MGVSVPGTTVFRKASRKSVTARQVRGAQPSAALWREGGAVERWSSGPRASYGLHDHPYGKLLVVLSGSITFSMGEQPRVVTLRPGDRLDLPFRTAHAAVAGPDGVVCLEARRYPKSVRRG